jgi:subtilase family serine protease
VKRRYRAAVALASCTTVVMSGLATGGDRAGAASAGDQLTVQVWLTPDLAGAERLAGAVSTPGTAEFGHYLSPNAYTARADAVASWLRHRGLTDVRVDDGRDYVAASGPASTVRSVFAAPAAIAPDVLAVTGLTGSAATRSAAVRKPAAPRCSQYWAQHVQRIRPSYKGFVKASLPICGYSAGQLRAVYGATWANTGRGQTVAFAESAPPTAMARTLATWASSNHLPAPKPGQFKQIDASSGGKCATPSRAAAAGYEDESEMDAEAVYAMAPGANQLMVVGAGCDEDQALLNAVVTVLNGDGFRPSATIVSNSWVLPEGAVPPQTVHAIAVRAAAEGVGLYFSSGDAPGLSVTTDDPFVTTVGGTTLGIGAHDNRVFETGWSNEEATLDGGKWTNIGNSGAAGGGTTPSYPQPAYQKGVVPASISHVKDGKRMVVGRAVPDIAADADLDTGLLTGYTDDGRYHTMVNAGTSLACPLIAGLVADAQQGRPIGFGFLNPLLYRLARTRAIRDVLPVNSSMLQQNRAAYTPADSTYSSSLDVFGSQNRAFTEQVIAKGYDTMTGIGTPNGSAFVTGLRNPPRR